MLKNFMGFSLWYFHWRLFAPARSIAPAPRRLSSGPLALSSGLDCCVEPCFANSTRKRKSLLPAGDLLAHPLHAFQMLGREVLAKILRLKEFANLHLRFSRHRIGAPLQPLDRLLHRPHLP